MHTAGVGLMIMMDEFTRAHGDLLTGSYDCTDRVVLNAYNPLCHSAGGFREWWRRLNGGSDEDLDNAHLMRMAGRLSRRVRGFAKREAIPVIDCGKGERKHRIAEEYLLEHPEAQGLFLILVARAVAPVWEVRRSSKRIFSIVKRLAFVNHYSFHIMDPEWGHVTIKMSGHPPFPAQVILNGHEYVACQARSRGVEFRKEENCFTHFSSAAELARVADTLSEPRTVGRLSQLCERWIYSSCLCFALDSAEQQRTGFRYEYSVYQVEYSRNLLFQVGAQMQQVFEAMVDRTRRRLDLREIRTIVGREQRPRTRPHRDRNPKPQVMVVTETPRYGLTVFKLHFGQLTLKVYTKGERVLRFEAIVHNTKALGCGRVVAKFPLVLAKLKAMLARFLDHLRWMDSPFVSDDTLDRLPLPCSIGKAQVGGIDPNNPRMRGVLAAVLALAASPNGFRVGDLAGKVREITGQTISQYGSHRAAYDLKKLRAKGLVSRVGASRRYEVPAAGIRTIAALSVLRDQVIKPLLASAKTPTGRPNRKTALSIDDHYRTLRADMEDLFADLHIAA